MLGGAPIWFKIWLIKDWLIYARFILYIFYGYRSDLQLRIYDTEAMKDYF